MINLAIGIGVIKPNGVGPTAAYDIANRQRMPSPHRRHGDKWAEQFYDANQVSEEEA